MMTKNYFMNLLVAIDQLGNALINGWADETLSSRSWRWHQDGIRSWPKNIIDFLFFFDENHCEESYNSEREGNYLPPELR